jgi:hypothetical protein
MDRQRQWQVPLRGEDEMTMFERGVGDLERPVGLGWKFPDAVALARWINPLLFQRRAR